MRNIKSIGLLAVSLLLAVAAGLAGYMYLERKERAITEELNAKANYMEVLVPIQNMNVGDVISADTVSIRPVPSAYVPDAALFPTDFDSIAGMAVSEPISAGKPLQRHQLEGMDNIEKFSQLLKPGQRAITLEIDQIESNENMLNVGDYIDIAVVIEPGKNKKGEEEDAKDFLEVRSVMERVLVLATGRKTISDPTFLYEGSSYEQGYSSITLGVDVEAIHNLVAAKEKGKLLFLLRNPNDEKKLKIGQGGSVLGGASGRVKVFSGGKATNGLLDESYRDLISSSQKKRWEIASLMNKEYKKYVPSASIAYYSEKDKESLATTEKAVEKGIGERPEIREKGNQNNKVAE